jgi:hypothetical protein
MWERPKTDWRKNPKGIDYSDMNRIEKNIKHLCDVVLK